MVDRETRRRVSDRSQNRCEYCIVPQDAYDIAFRIDHILPQQHVADDTEANLALACPQCNRKKRPNLAGFDAVTQSVVPLFHPRRDAWNVHFQWTGYRIVGITPSGRASVALLDLNSEDHLRMRASLAAEGRFPPTL